MDRNFRIVYRRFLMGDCERLLLRRYGLFIYYLYLFSVIWMICYGFDIEIIMML